MSVIDQAKSELDRLGADEEFKSLIIGTMEQFFERYDSGGAVAIMAPSFLHKLQRCIAGKPLTPLTGDNSEWMDCSYGGPVCWQNVRCSTVFKDAEGRCYDIDTPGRPTITFPYDPERADIPFPILEIEVNGDAAHSADDTRDAS